jgi:hypothetical protein
MTTPPHPKLWRFLAGLLAALRALMNSAAPEAFWSISAEARTRLALLTALVRRYLHILSAGITLPASQPNPARPPAERTRSVRTRPFRLTELPAREQYRRAHMPGETDPPDLHWALLMQRLGGLAQVLADPVRHARRLARHQRRYGLETLRDLPVPWHMLCRIEPALDTLLLDLDRLARPDAWARIDTS